MKREKENWSENWQKIDVERSFLLYKQLNQRPKGEEKHKKEIEFSWFFQKHFQVFIKNSS